MIKKGDKFVAIKSMWFVKEGDIIEVTDVAEDMFHFKSSNGGSGNMNFSFCEKYFEKVVEPEEEIEEKTYIDIMLENSEFEVFVVFDRCMIVSCKLPNEYIITESYSSANEEIFDEDVAFDACLSKITIKLCELEEYLSFETSYNEEATLGFSCEDCEECACECEGNCEDCAEKEINICLKTDLDCSDCNDFNCRFNTNK